MNYGWVRTCVFWVLKSSLRIMSTIWIAIRGFFALFIFFKTTNSRFALSSLYVVRGNQLCVWCDEGEISLWHWRSVQSFCWKVVTSFPCLFCARFWWIWKVVVCLIFVFLFFIISESTFEFKMSWKRRVYFWSLCYICMSCQLMSNNSLSLTISIYLLD